MWVCYKQNYSTFNKQLCVYDRAFRSFMTQKEQNNSTELFQAFGDVLSSFVLFSSKETESVVFFFIWLSTQGRYRFAARCCTLPSNSVLIIRELELYCIFHAKAYQWVIKITTRGVVCSKLLIMKASTVLAFYKAELQSFGCFRSLIIVTLILISRPAGAFQGGCMYGYYF